MRMVARAQQVMPVLAAFGAFVGAEAAIRRFDEALEPACRAAASVVAAILRLTGAAVAQHGAILVAPGGFAYQIDGACLGIGPLALVAALVIFDRAVMMRRLAWLPVAMAGLALLNLLRLVGLFRVGTEALSSFPFAHDVAWPALMVGTILAVWCALRSPPSGQRPADRPAIAPA